MSLELTFERCVHARATTASCRACVDACPDEAIALVPAGSRTTVEVAMDRCTRCGVCQAACPTEALHSVVDVAGLHARGLGRLACGSDGLSCVGALAAEDLLALAAAAPGRSLRLEATGTACTARGHERAQRAVAEARTVADALQLGLTIELDDRSSPRPPAAARSEPPVPPRRQFLALLVPAVAPPPAPRLVPRVPLDAALLRTPRATARRKRFLASLPAAVRLRTESLPAAQLALTTSKRLDIGKCNASGQCVAACPTGALSMSRVRDRLSFDASLCVACRLCHDVCQPGALTVEASVSLTELVDLAPALLGRLAVVQCPDCGVFHADPSRGDDPRCPRCRSHDDEALALWRAP